MAAARRPKAYPKGHGLPLTSTWKRRVIEAIEVNRIAGHRPSSVGDLSHMIGADPTGIGRMLTGDQPSSKYTHKICEILRLDPPMQEVANDELDAAITRLRKLPADRRKRVLEMLRLLEPDVDG